MDLSYEYVIMVISNVILCVLVFFIIQLRFLLYEPGGDQKTFEGDKCRNLIVTSLVLLAY